MNSAGHKTKTMKENHVLNFMDLMDLDEDLVDSRLKAIIARNSYTNGHFETAVHLLKYKHLINLQEGTECDNDEEFNYIVKLMNSVTSNNINNICQITYYILILNKTSIISKSEHLVQQILSGIEVNKEWTDDASESEDLLKILHSFKLCESVLDALIESGEKISLLFLDTPLEKIISVPQDKLIGHFLINTVPKLVEGVIGYNILDRIWNYLKTFKDFNKNSLKVLSCLSEFYLPVPDGKGNRKFESEIIFQIEFWNLLLLGLKTNNPSIRKLAAYLIKRAIDSIIILKTDIIINTEMETLFLWQKKNGVELKRKWDDFFILIDSLEEKQSNIVLPSLKIFETLNGIPVCWLNCAFNIGLKHDNTQVRVKCIKHRLKIPLDKEEEATILLEALNDINIYDDTKECEHVKDNLFDYLVNVQNLMNVIKVIPKVKWSPVPLYHLSTILATIIVDLQNVDASVLCQLIDDILKVPCNNVAIRKAVYINMSYFIANCCKSLCWKDILTVFSFKVNSSSKSLNNPLNAIVKRFKLQKEDKKDFFKTATNSYKYISIIFKYLENHPYDVTIFIDVLKEKIGKIQNIVNRQYSDKTECFDDVLFIIAIMSENAKHTNEITDIVNKVLMKETKSLAQYLLNLLTNDNNLEVEEVKLLFKEFDSNLFNNDTKDIFLQIYKTATLLLRDNTADINKRVLSIYIFNEIGRNVNIIENYKHELLNIDKFLDVIHGIELKDSEDNGRLRNLYYEKICETVEYLMAKDEKKSYCGLEKVLDFIKHALDCGGYGCLGWILKVMKNILPTLLNDDKVQFDIVKFINRVWKEIEELKSNNQYTPCIEEFVGLLTQDELLKKSMYNNIIILYSNKIIEHGVLKNTPLYFLATKLNEKKITEDYGQIIFVLCEILLFNPVVRKDQRVLENVAVEILNEPKYGLNRNEIDTHFNIEIQLLAISTLCKIEDPTIFKTIVSFIIRNIEDTFRNKPRYHGNSLPHRLLLIGIQHLLLITLLNNKVVQEEMVVDWCIEFLGRLPHQPSVRICLEWLIALHVYAKKHPVGEELLQKLKSKNISLSSQFMIFYLILKQKVKNDYNHEEFEFVMDTLLSHTMGQMFNVRLHAQYLSTILNKVGKENDKYKYIIKVIEDTFVESCKDKNFVKLKKDYFANEFDIIRDLTPCFIYYFLPKYCDIGANEAVDNINLKQVLKVVNDTIEKAERDEFKRDWLKLRKSDEDVFEFSFNKALAVDKDAAGSESSGIIQKKYVPWKNMNDIDVYATEKKLESPSGLIVVASLIDKLPNLGGMARTSEVFGVKTYVVDSLRHLQEKQFQGLSVSAERWVNVEEVRPGQPLKDYLMMMKTEGYSIVAAEQTSNSCPLQTFKFPKKTLLLLGHEKEGVPCDLLPITDHCVEIPQLGFVRSLNVHVTASIFIWEYTRQNILNLNK